MSEEPPDPLAQLGEKIEQLRRERVHPQASGTNASPQNPLGLAFRIAIELVASLAVGIAIGWAIDWGIGRVFGVREYAGRIVFFFIGAAAGMLNVFRAAKDLGRSPPPQQSRARQDKG
jgi:ATP synthase protein I